jgi:uncharacterized membrane protein YjjP (DUF1212 family)
MPPTRNLSFYKHPSNNAYNSIAPYDGMYSQELLDSTGTSLRRPGTDGNALLRRRSTAVLDSHEKLRPENASNRPATGSDVLCGRAELDQADPSSRRPTLGRATSSKGRVPSLRSSQIRGVQSPAGGNDTGRLSAAPKVSYKERLQLLRKQSREIYEHVERKQCFLPSHPPSYTRQSAYQDRVDFILVLAQTLLAFGAPSHRIESQLQSAADILQVNVGFVHLPSLLIANLMDSGTVVSETRFVRAGGRIALTSLHRVHLVYRDVLHDKVGVREGTDRLRKLLRARPIYPNWVRCIFAFICASIICTTAFGGSLLDMFISGTGASALQFLGLNVATKSAMYANVYE